MSRFAAGATRFLTEGSDSPNWGALGRVNAAAKSLTDSAELQSAIRREVGDINYEGGQELLKLGADTRSAVQGFNDQASLFNTLGQVGSAVAGGIGSKMFSSPTAGTPDFGYDEVSFGKIADPTADIQRALGPGVPFGMYDNSFR